MRTTILGLWVAVVILTVPAKVFGGTITLTAGDGLANVGEHILANIDVTALDLGGIAGVDTVTLNFGAKDAGLQVGTFTPGDLLTGWEDATVRPPYPTCAWNFVNVSATDITHTGTLGTLEVWSDLAGTYSLAFDMTSGLPTEVGGGGEAFAVTTGSGTIQVPEPATLGLLVAGAMTFMCRRRK
jgi:hypothetical protein